MPSDTSSAGSDVDIAGDRIGEAVARLVQLAESMAERGEAIPETALRQLVTTTVRLYAAAAEGGGIAPTPTDGTLSTTESVVLAVALLREQNLTAFDTALWFSRTAT